MRRPPADPRSPQERVLAKARDLAEQVRQTAERVHQEAQESRRLTEIARRYSEKGRQLLKSGRAGAPTELEPISWSLENTRKSERRLPGKINDDELDR
jgi:hypothetical protein